MSLGLKQEQGGMTANMERSWWQRNWKWFVPLLGIGVVILFVSFIALILSLVFGMMKSSYVYNHAMEEAKANPNVQKALGEPVKAGLLVAGNISVNGHSGHADLSIPVSGPDGKGTIYAVAQKSSGEWRFKTFLVAVESTGQQINLLFDTDDVRVGKVTAQHGDAIYGTSIEYAEDIYLGRLSKGDAIHLEDTTLDWDEYDDPIIKVKALDGDDAGTVCWIDLDSTSFLDLYDPATRQLDLSRAELRGLDQEQINEVIRQRRAVE